MKDPLYTRLLIVALVLLLGVFALFTAAPQLDLAISRAFTDADGQFWLTLTPAPGAFNAALKKVLELLAYGVVLATLVMVILRRRPQSGLRNWLFLSGVFLVGPGLIVNLILKEHSGRARPANVIEFGGEKLFTPVLHFTDQCASNCSFSSGETALSSAVAFAFLVLLWPHLGKRGRLVGLLTGAGLIGVTLGLRIGLGRHFASDALTSVAISALVALGFYRLCGLAQARQSFTRAALVADLRALGARLRRRFSAT